jgi:hypothetical protein
MNIIASILAAGFILALADVAHAEPPGFVLRQDGNGLLF